MGFHAHFQEVGYIDSLLTKTESDTVAKNPEYFCRLSENVPISSVRAPKNRL